MDKYAIHCKLYPRSQLNNPLISSKDNSKIPKNPWRNHNPTNLPHQIPKHSPTSRKWYHTNKNNSHLAYVLRAPIKCYQYVSIILPLIPVVTSPGRERSHPSHEVPAPGLNASSLATVLSEAAGPAPQASGDSVD